MGPTISRTQQAIIAGIFLFVLSAAVEGIIGNRADALLPLIGPFFQQEIKLQVAFLILIIAGSACVPSFFLLRYRTAYRNATSLNRIDGNLNRSIAILHKSQDSQERAKMARQTTGFLLKGVLKLSLFQSCGIAVYRPNDTNTRLKPWLRMGQPNRDDDELSFYIDNTDSFYLGESEATTPSLKSRWYVGKTFIDGELRVAQFNKEGGNSSGNGPRREEDSGGTYRSLICVVISSGDPYTGSLGVLCLYSKAERTFNEAAQEFITTIAQRLSIVLEAISNQEDRHNRID